MVYVSFSNEEVAQATALMLEALRNGEMQDENWYFEANDAALIPIDQATIALFYCSMKKGESKLEIPWSYPKGTVIYRYDLIHMLQENTTTGKVRRMVRMCGTSNCRTSPWYSLGDGASYANPSRRPEEMMNDVPGNFDGKLGTVVQDDGAGDMDIESYFPRLPVGTSRAMAAGSLVLGGNASELTGNSKGAAKGKGYGRSGI